MKLTSEHVVTLALSGKEAREIFDFLHNDYKLEYLGDDPFPKKAINDLYKQLDSLFYPES